MVVWGIALLLGVGIVAQHVHAHSARPRACTRHDARAKPECVQRDQTLLYAGVAAITIVMGTAVAVALTKP